MMVPRLDLTKPVAEGSVQATDSINDMIGGG